MNMKFLRKRKAKSRHPDSRAFYSPSAPALRFRDRSSRAARKRLSAMRAGSLPGVAAIAKPLGLG